MAARKKRAETAGEEKKAVEAPAQQLRYEFTGETKVVYGVTLKRIRALVAIASIGVSPGDLGGWIESEANLARVFGDAWVFGDASKTTICVSGLTYLVTITDQHIRIGCEFHLITEWREFDDHRIAEMDGTTSARFWRDHKAIILGLCEASGRPFSTERAAQ